VNQTLINEISREFGIIRESFEDDKAWQNRIKYSVLGLQMLSALYDKYDDFDDTPNNSSVSRQHISSRAKKLAEIFGINQERCEDILQLYIETGFILRKSNRLACPPASTAQVGLSCIARGVHPSFAKLISGFGFLVKSDNSTKSSVDDMFNLVTVDIKQWTEMFMNNLKGEWKSNEDLTDFEFINAQATVWKSYWTDIAPKSGLSLCRSKDEVGRIYKLLSIKKDVVNGLRLPEWTTNNGEYLRLAISLRVTNKNPPKAKAKKYIRTTIFEYDYKLPPAEQNFIELYSWKRDNSQDKYKWPYSRIVSNELYQVFITIFHRLGYTIKEEQAFGNRAINP